MAWNPVAGFTFGFDDFTTRSTESGQYDPTAEKIIVWPQAKPIPGKVNQDAGIIQFSIPRSYLMAQVGGTGKGQVPDVKGAKTGSKFFDATVWTMGNMFTPVQARQSYLYQVDQTAAMDFVLGKGKPAKPGVPMK